MNYINAFSYTLLHCLKTMISKSMYYGATVAARKQWLSHCVGFFDLKKPQHIQHLLCQRLSEIIFL